MFPDPTPTPFISPETTEKGYDALLTGFYFAIDYWPISLALVVGILFLLRKSIWGFMKSMNSLFRGDF
jgi:hypothetical protein